MATADTSGYAGITNPELIENGFDQFIQIYNATGATLYEGDDIMLAIDSTYGVKAIAVATSATVPRRQGIVVGSRDLATIAIAGTGLVQTRGYCLKVKTAATAADHFIKGTNALVQTADDGITQTVNSIGITMAAAASGFAPAMLFGDLTVI